MFFSLCYSLGGFKIFCLFAMFALVNIKYKRKPAENEINVYSACLCGRDLERPAGLFVVHNSISLRLGICLGGSSAIA